MAIQRAVPKSICGCILALLTLLTFLTLLSPPTWGGEDRPLSIETRAARDQSNNIRQHLMRVAQELSHGALAGIDTLADW